MYTVHMEGGMSETFVVRKRSVAEVLLAVALIASLAVVVLYRERYQKLYVMKEQEELKLIADNLALDHEGAIYGIRQFLITSGYLVEQSRVDKEGCQKVLQRMSVVYPYFLNIGIADAGGTVTCSGVSTGDQIVSFVDDPDFAEARDTHGFTVSGYRISTITGRPSVRFMQPIIDNQKFVGVLFMTFSVEWLNGFTPPLGTELDHKVMEKFDADGNVFMRYPNPIVWSGTNQADSEVFTRIKGEKSGFAYISDLDGVKRLYYFRPIYTDGKIHAYVVVGSNVGKL